jgi:hypothetical protein
MGFSAGAGTELEPGTDMVNRVDKHRALSVLLCTLTLVTVGGCAARQPARSFSDLQQRVRPGHTVFVIDDTGSETKGKVVEISASDLTLDVNGVRRPMDSASIRQVQRYGDSLWNGLLIGIAVGIPGAVISDSGSQPCEDDPQKRCAYGQGRFLVLAMMGALGAGIDALSRSRHQVYLADGQPVESARRVRVSPRVGLSTVGLSVTIDLNKRTIAKSGRARSKAERFALAASRAGIRAPAEIDPLSSPE